MSAPRIASLIPSATEIIDVLGLADRMVARSHECDFPAGIDHLPALTGPAFKTGGSLREIDTKVRELLEKALSIYWLDVDKLQELKPTHIITQDQCEVCAVSLGEVEDAVCTLSGVDTKVVSLQPKRLPDVWGDIEAVGRSLGVDGAPAAAACAARVEAIAHELADEPTRQRVACLEWPDPVYSAGSWLPDIVSAAGGLEVTGTAGVHARQIDWPEVAAADPDVVVVAPCGFGLERTTAETRLIADHPGWRGLRAVQAGEAYVVDANSFFSRPGPRLVGSVEIMAEILYPERFDFGRKGRDWARFDA